jgi:tRNA-Thr(GGU) m(6)t(6)A37 methyltransferase TsaA
LKIELHPVGFVHASRSEVVDDFWGEEESCITLTEEFSAESLAGITDFSHCEILFFLSRVEPARVINGARHPRNNDKWPKVGVFAQRTKNRPNRIGSTICRIVRVEGKHLFVSELDAIHGTPVLDIKPVLREFLPRGEVKQPEWSHELMREYWLSKNH